MAKKQTTALASWDDKLAALGAKDQVALKQFQGGGRFTWISHEGGVLKIGKQELPGNQGRFVALAYIAHNVLYDPSKPYVRGKPSFPICYAFAGEGEGMSPHPDAPQKQATSCATCQMAQKGSGKDGEGKACKQTLRMALIAENDVDKGAEAEVYALSLPPTSAWRWTKAVEETKVLGLKTPRVASFSLGVTRNTGSRAQYALTFSQFQKIDTELYAKLFEAIESVGDDTLAYPYPTSADDPSTSTTVAASEGQPSVTKKTLKGKGKY